MQKGILTEKEKEVLHTLLLERGIIIYCLFDVTNEGINLPGSTYPCEIESMSGTIITPSKIYDFWLDWFDGHYTLGEEEGIWKEMNIEEFGWNKDRIIQIQQQLAKENSGTC